MMVRSDNNTPLPLDIARLAQQLREATSPEPTDALLDRITSSRANGVRVLITDTIEPGAARRRRWPWMVLAACAAGGAFLVWREQPRNTPSIAAKAKPPANAADSAPSPRAPMAALLSPWPQVAYAQGAGNAPFTPLGAVNSGRLTFGERMYLRTSANSYHDFVPHELWSTRLSSGTRNGIATIQLVRERVSKYRIDDSGELSASFDTLWLRASDLRPLYHHRGQLPFDVRTTYTDSSAVERTTMDNAMIQRLAESAKPSKATTPRLRTYEWSTTTRIDKARHYVDREDVLRLLLRAATLDANWRASITVPAVGFNDLYSRDGKTRFLNLRVTGIDTVQLFSGRVECWRVELDTGPQPEVWHVDRATGETLTTSGRYDRNYPETRTVLVGGLELKQRLVPEKRKE
ncbi:MAG: hypothetical protein IBJ03_14010 [Gemmatimonadaceae bacterium]|nr:hypothetical protein [Gemmatimonadaceae bacterium]